MRRVACCLRWHFGRAARTRAAARPASSGPAAVPIFRSLGRYGARLRSRRCADAARAPAAAAAPGVVLARGNVVARLLQPLAERAWRALALRVSRAHVLFSRARLCADPPLVGWLARAADEEHHRRRIRHGLHARAGTARRDAVAPRAGGCPWRPRRRSGRVTRCVLGRGSASDPPRHAPRSTSRRRSRTWRTARRAASW